MSKAWIALLILTCYMISGPALQAQEGSGQLSEEQLEMIARTIANKSWVETFLGDADGKDVLEGSAPFNIELNVVDVELQAGESEEYALNVVNVQDETLVVLVYLSGGFSDFVELEKNTLQIPAGGSETVKFSISIPQGTTIGVYSGKLYVRSPDWVEGVAMDIKVIPSEKPILESKVTALTKDLEPGKDLLLLVEVYNQGRSGSIPLEITHKIVNAKTDEVVASVSEPHNLTTSLLYQKKISLGGAGEGRYIAEVTTSYKEGVISSTDYFSVKRPIPVTLIATILGLGVLSFAGLKTKSYYKKLKLEKSRYVPILDEKELPKGGDDSLFVGKVADLNIKTFFGLEDLLTHVLIAGGTGYGKSVAAMDIAEEVLDNDIPVIVADPTLQWTGFLNPNDDEDMFKLYPDFGMKKEEARRFKGTVIEVAETEGKIDLTEYMKPGEITVLGLNNLQPDQIDEAISSIIGSIMDAHLEESSRLKCLLVFDEVHRLLPKYGGKEAYSHLETAITEFRRWGVGMMLVSQVLSDFKATIHGNIGTEIQMKTKFAGDMSRIEQKYGAAYSRTLVKEPVGVGMVANSNYNNGQPYFVKFRPLFHSTLRMSEEDLKMYHELFILKNKAEARIKSLKEEGKETAGLEFELKLGVDKLKEGQQSLANIYLKTLNEKLEEGGTNA
ncbi:MAG: DUF87 domain-containing protein [Candidatus Hydrothermarchaeales archaeon]